MYMYVTYHHFHYNVARQSLHAHLECSVFNLKLHEQTKFISLDIKTVAFIPNADIFKWNSKLSLKKG